MANQALPFPQWFNYQPTKTVLVTACVASMGLTALVGFTWGGWVSEGTANQRAQQAVAQARAELASAVCVERFLAAADVRTRLGELKAASSWDRDDLIEKAGWSTPPGSKGPVEDAAELCATQLAEMQLPADGAAVKPAAASAVQ